MPETTALGAAMAAGSAEGVGVWDISSQSESPLTTDDFTPAVSSSGNWHSNLPWMFKKAISDKIWNGSRKVPCPGHELPWFTLDQGLQVVLNAHMGKYFGRFYTNSSSDLIFLKRGYFSCSDIAL